MIAQHTVKVLWQRESGRFYIHAVHLDDQKRTVTRRRFQTLKWPTYEVVEDRIIKQHTEKDVLINRAKIYKLKDSWAIMCAVLKELAKRELELEGPDLAGLRDDIEIIAPPEVIESWKNVIIPQAPKAKKPKTLPVQDAKAISGMTLEEYREKEMVPKAELAYSVVTEITNIHDNGYVPLAVINNRVGAACPECRTFGPVWLETPLLMCQKCLNAGAGGQWRKVGVPGDFAKIVKVLEKRPSPETRNYAPGETLVDLKRENKEHGIK